MTVGSNGLRASSTVNGTPLRTLGTFATGADRGRSARRAPCDRASEQRRTKADPRTRRGGESAYGSYSASEDEERTILGSTVPLRSSELIPSWYCVDVTTQEQPHLLAPQSSTRLPSERFHGLSNSLFKVLFNFPSRYLFAVGLAVISFAGLRWGLPPT